MYKIGEFAKIIDIDVRTLRYYDNIGVLQPSEIDNYTGYRYYNDENVKQYQYIKLLKSLGFTLEEIKKYKDCLDEEIIIKKKKELEERMYLLSLKYERLVLLEEQVMNKNKVLKKIDETPKEKVLRRKYEKRDVRKNI